MPLLTGVSSSSGTLKVIGGLLTGRGLGGIRTTSDYRNPETVLNAGYYEVDADCRN